LISNFGNFINRSLTLAKDVSIDKKINLDKKIVSQSNKSYKKIIKSLSKVRFKDYYNEFVNFSGFANRYISLQKP
jgi:methionyl-tRNA synthetase